MIEAWLGGRLGASGSLVWTAPDVAVWIAAAAALIVWGLAWSGTRGALARGIELAALGAALVGLVVAIARPVWVEPSGREVPGRLVVLVDGSGSMAVEEEGRPRYAAVEGWLRSLRSQPGVEVLHFGDTLAAGEPVAYQRSQTDLGAALSQLSDRYAGERLAGVVVISDGIDRGGLRAMWRSGEDPEPPSVPGPLTVAAVGTPGAIRDLSVVSVDSGGYAYLRTPVEIRARIAGPGFEGRSVTARLLKDGARVQERAVELDEEGQAEVAFEITPTEAGRSAWSVQVPSYEGDAVPGNNELPFVLRVVRDRIRVLQVAGAPSWDVKFLRRFLKGDPSVDLVSFFILRTREDAESRRWSDQELSLIQFPYRDLFTTEIETFDLVIFQNFDYTEFFHPAEVDQLLENVRAHVMEGGHGFVMVGGDRSFDLARYGQTPLREVLPVALAPEPTAPSEEAFRPALTEAGGRHPVTRLVADPVDNQAWWARLHPLDGVHRGVGRRSGATVLLEHPEVDGIDGMPAPVVAVREAGRGRAMALTVDTTWRWSLSEAAAGRGNQAYLRFWKQAMRWLVKDATAERVTVEPERENVALGEPARLVIRARDAGFLPVEGADVEVEVRRGVEQQPAAGRTNADGELVVEVPSEVRGAHRVRAVVRRGQEVLGEAETVYAVSSRDPELEEVTPDPAFLKWLAERSGGRFYPPGQQGEVLRDETADRTAWDRHEVALWRSPLLMSWIAGFGGLAWLVRRRAGLR